MIRIHFRYNEETWTTYNKTLTITILIISVLAFIGSFAESNNPSEKPNFIVLGLIYIVLGLVYLFFAIRALKIWLKRKNLMDGARICQGYIINKIVTSGWRRTSVDDSSHGWYSYISLLVQYVDPYTGVVKQLETPIVNGDPFTYLSSLDVAVYVKPDGSAWATEFKWIKSLKDSWSRNNPEEANRIKPIQKDE